VVKLKTATIVAGVIAVVLLPRVVFTVDAAIAVFPIDPDVIHFVDLDPAPWYSALFVASHACVAWFVVLWWRGSATLWLEDTHADCVRGVDYPLRGDPATLVRWSGNTALLRSRRGSQLRQRYNRSALRQHGCGCPTGTAANCTDIPLEIALGPG